MNNDYIPPIAIATLGRKRIQTLEWFTPEVQQRVTLFCNRAQVATLRRDYPLVGAVVACPFQPEPGEKADGVAKGLSPIRHWLMDYYRKMSPVVIIADDDTTFWIRINRKVLTDWKCRRATPEETTELIRDMCARTTAETPMVGVALKQGNNRYSTAFAINQRMCGFWTVYVPEYHRLKLSFAEVPSMQDFWTMLSFITLGRRTGLICDRMHNPSASGSAGGCSVYRTNDTQKVSVGRLVYRFSAFVKPKVKATKHGWFGGERLDVTVQWKKAYEFGQQFGKLL